MPEAEIADNNASFLDNWLRWWSNFSSCIQQLFLNSAASAVTMCAFLIRDGSVIVSTEPDLC